MKSALATLLIFSFLGVAVFGFLAVGHGMTHGICLFANFAAAGGAKPPCPLQDPLGFVNFHIDIFKSFSTAPFADSLTLAAFSAILLFLLVAFLFESAPFLFRNISPPFIGALGYAPEKIAAKKTLHWLSLHENSPALI